MYYVCLCDTFATNIFNAIYQVQKEYSILCKVNISQIRALLFQLFQSCVQ